MLEALYLDMLDNYKKEPRDANWESIEAQLKEDRAHTQIKSKFEHFAATPALKNWQAIEQKMVQPNSNNHIRRILSTAATIALLLFILTFTGDNSKTKFADILVGLSSVDALSYNLCQDPAVVALDIVKPVLKKNKKSKRKPKATSKQKRLLDIILEKDENIESEVDSVLIAELLSPVAMLSESSMFANLNGPYFYYRQGADFRMMYALPEIDYHLIMPSDTQRTIIHHQVKARNNP